MPDIMLRLWVITMANEANELIWYKVTFKQIGPIHIGEKNYGVLSETKVFIPGWTLWGALVNSYGKFKGGRAKDFEEGKRIFENITCFYPKIDDEPMFPNLKDGRLYIGNISEKQFRINYTDVFMSTAINPMYISAKDASLHETEIILHKSKDKKKNIYWIGLLGIKTEYNSKFNEFINNLDEISVGGEISYGFGQMKMDEKPLPVSEDNLNNWNLKNDGSLLINSKNSDPIKNYIRLSDDIKFVNSKLEYVVQYNFIKTHHLIDSKGYYFIPGSKILECNKNVSFRLKKGMYI